MITKKMPAKKAAKPAEKPEGFHIIQFEAENIKKLKAVTITPRGNVIQVTGPNGSGKSSVLDAIFYALCGMADIPANVVRKGAAKGHVTIRIGDLTVTRRFTADGSRGGVLEILRDDGSVLRSPQHVLDQLMGAITVDPLAFMRMSAKERVEVLRNTVPELAAAVAKVDEAIKADYDERRSLGRESDGAMVRLSAALSIDRTWKKEEIQTAIDRVPSADVNLEDLTRQLREAGEANATRENLIRQREQLAATAKANEEQAHAATLAAASLTLQAEKLLEEAKRQESLAAECRGEAEAATKAHKAMQVPDKIDVGDAERRLNHATKQQTAIALKREYTAKRDAAEKLDAAIEERRAGRKRMVEEATMPLPGLSFNGEEVTYEEIAFDQLSDADRIRISVALAMAGNPKIRVLRIKDGSLLDSSSFAQIAAMAEEANFQVWIERVDESGKVGVVMSDGEVAEYAE